MERYDNPQLQLEATWTMGGLTAGTQDQTEKIILEGAIPILIKLLHSCNVKLLEHTCAAVANIACELDGRDLLLYYGVLHPLIDVLKKSFTTENAYLVKVGTRALSILCRGRPPPDYEQIVDATPYFCTAIKEVTTDTKILSNILWALSSLSDSEEKVARVLEADVVPSIIQSLDCTDDNVMKPALQILGNILGGSDDQADRLLKISQTRSYIKKLFRLLKERHSKFIKRKICWSLSNIACQRSSMGLVFDNPEYVKQLMNIALQEDEVEVKKEAVWALANATEFGNKTQLMSMVRNGIFDCMCKVIQLDQPNETIIVVALRGMGNFLTVSQLMSRKRAINNQCLIKLKQKGPLRKIKVLNKSESVELSQLAFEIWNKYLRRDILRRKLRLKRAVICYRNERHSLFGIWKNKKKKLCV